MIELQDLTSGTVAGTGVFDELMRATKEHIKDEYQAGRIKGTEYATVYLGGLQTCMQTALQFVMAQDKANKELELLDKDLLLKDQALLNAQAEHAVLVNQALKLEADIALTEAQTIKTAADTALTDAQTLNVPKQGALIDAQKDVAAQEVIKLTADTALTNAQSLNVPKQGALIEAQTAVAVKEADLADEKIALAMEEVLVAKEKVLVSKEEVLIAKAKLVNIPKEGAMLDAQAAQVGAETLLTNQKTTNSVTENTVLIAQECKLRAEYDTLVQQVLKIAAEASLLAQKKLTEEAQINGAVIDANSVIGRQISLYTAQANGYKRDAEQRAAKIAADLMGVQMSVSDYEANSTNGISDQFLGRVMRQLYKGVEVDLTGLPTG